MTHWNDFNEFMEDLESALGIKAKKKEKRTMKTKGGKLLLTKNTRIQTKLNDELKDIANLLDGARNLLEVKTLIARYRDNRDQHAAAQDEISDVCFIEQFYKG
jgi:hypothetical protein